MDKLRWLCLFLMVMVGVMGFVADVSAGVAVQFFDAENIAIVEGGVKARVHLACIKVPSLMEPFGKLALLELQELIGDRLNGVKQFRKDRVGRVIGEVYADGDNVNLLMVKRGWARFDRQFTYAKECKGYSEAEQLAQAGKLGIWQR